MFKKSKILILSNSLLHRDPRVAIQIQALKDSYDLVCCGQSQPPDKQVEFVSFNKSTSQSLFSLPRIAKNQLLRSRWWKTKDYESIYFSQETLRQTFQRLKNCKPDLILCNDINSLPMAAKLKQLCGAKLYLDAHEYTPLEFDAEDGFEAMNEYWTKLIQAYSSHIDCFTTVCESIAREYEKNFGIATSEVVYNFPSPQLLVPSLPLENKIRMVHHGGASPQRGTKFMVDLMSQLDSRFTLDFIFVNNVSPYVSKLKAECSNDPRIGFQEPVPTKEIPRRINGYDLGLYLLCPSSYNNTVALPNKFFEFIQARLGIAIWPSIEMKRVVEQYDIGVVAGDFTVEAMAKELNQLGSNEVLRFKSNSDRAASVLNADDSMGKIRRLVDALVSA